MSRSERPTVAAPSLWRLPRRAIAAVLLVEIAAVVAVVVSGLRPPSVTEIGFAVLLAALSLVHTELATGIERVRRRVAVSSYFDLSSVWTFAAALLLPPAPAAAVIVLVYAHLWVRVWRPAKVPLHRHAFTTATVVLAAGAAHAVVGVFGIPHTADDLGAVLGLGAAVLMYALVNTALIALAIGLSMPSKPAHARDLLGRWDDNALEVATLCMGALAAVAVDHSPGLVLLALPPILVLHRAVLVRHLEEAASTDAKTGLLNAASWQGMARHSAQRAHRAGSAAAVLILDLDHFKDVNDRYGHLAGDEVLAAVAAELRSGVREADVVGRFGGEEFVVLLPGLTPGQVGRAELVDVAERLRSRVGGLTVTADTPDGRRPIRGITVSVGATMSADGTPVEEMLKAADTALYAAKAAGRNRVRVAGDIPGPQPVAGDGTIPAPRTPHHPSVAGSRHDLAG